MAYSLLEIPLVPAQAQTLRISLNGVDYRLTFRWNRAAAIWIMDIADVADVPLVRGIPVVTGVDLLGQYEYLNIGHLVATTIGGLPPDNVPTFENLGVDGMLYLVVPG